MILGYINTRLCCRYKPK